MSNVDTPTIVVRLLIPLNNIIGNKNIEANAPLLEPDHTDMRTHRIIKEDNTNQSNLLCEESDLLENKNKDIAEIM
ncbi:hypothetical protein [Aeromonas caviae]